ncbi:hypothetical protein E4U41_001997 [Claviceps citrina]|nr:hypothetical protein E4U41_001997 [Claviceps citrina]
MDCQGLYIRNLGHVFGQHCDVSSPYAKALAEAFSPSTPAYDNADSSPQACHSDENGSVYDSPAPPSPAMNNGSLYPCSFQSPASSSGGFPSPRHAQSTSAAAVTTTTSFHRGPHPDLDNIARSPPKSSGDLLRAKPSSSPSSSSSSCALPPWTHLPAARPQTKAADKHHHQQQQQHAPSAQPGRDYPVCCLYPGCDAKPFRRRADLDRHYKHRHATDAQKISFNCDYPRCSRRRDPFHRLDHFRDHLREFHKEDIEKRGSGSGSGSSVNEEWLEDRRVSSTWWRCPKCLHRIYIKHNGYECPDCKTPCQAKRIEARRRS